MIENSDNLEEIVLGAILQDGNLIQEAGLTPEYFQDPRNRLIAETMLDMHRQNIPIDEFTLFNEIRKRGLESKIGGCSYFGFLKDVTPTTANFAYYVQRLAAASRRRRLWETAHRLAQVIERGAERETETIAHLGAEIARLSQPEERNNLKPVSACELPDEGPILSLWGDIVYPGSIIQINAEPGIGKTTFVYGLGLHGAMGRDFLGIAFSRPIIKTLYVDTETPKWRRKFKIRAICSGDTPRDFFLLDELDFRRDFQPFLSLCKREGYDVIVLDTQSRILKMQDENDNSEATYLCGLLRQLTQQTGCALMLIHHTAKNEGKGVYRGRGASAIAGAVDVVMNIEALDDEVLKLIVAKNRIVGTNPVLFLRKAGEDRFEPHTPPDGSSGFEIFKAQDAINALSDTREWATAEIYEEGRRAGFSESTVKRALGRLIEAGKWQRVKKGIYRKSAWVNGSGVYPEPIDPIDPLSKKSNDEWNLGTGQDFCKSIDDGLRILKFDPSLPEGHSEACDCPSCIPDPWEDAHD
jgi:hypothetical protein